MTFIIVALMFLVACAPVHYKVCDGTSCRPMNKTEAIDAADVSKEWGDKSTLTLHIQKER